MKKKKKYIRNGIVFDRNLPELDVFDFDYEDNEKNKKKYYAGKGKRKIWRGI